MDDLARKLYHMERELSNHSQILAANAESMKNLSERSDERLEYIRQEFTELKGLIREDRLEARDARRRMIGAATSTFLAFATATWFVIIQPVFNELAIVERRLLDVEKRLEVSFPLDDDDQPQ